MQVPVWLIICFVGMSAAMDGDGQLKHIRSPFTRGMWQPDADRTPDAPRKWYDFMKHVSPLRPTTWFSVPRKDLAQLHPGAQVLGVHGFHRPFISRSTVLELLDKETEHYKYASNGGMGISHGAKIKLPGWSGVPPFIMLDIDYSNALESISRAQYAQLIASTRSYVKQARFPTILSFRMTMWKLHAKDDGRREWEPLFQASISGKEEQIERPAAAWGPENPHFRRVRLPHR